MSFPLDSTFEVKLITYAKGNPEYVVFRTDYFEKGTHVTPVGYFSEEEIANEFLTKLEKNAKRANERTQRALARKAKENALCSTDEGSGGS
jgi:hypothetical protein